MRPIVRGLCKYESILDGSPLDLSDFQRMNDALDAIEENERRLNPPDRDR